MFFISNQECLPEIFFVVFLEAGSPENGMPYDCASPNSCGVVETLQLRLYRSMMECPVSVARLLVAVPRKGRCAIILTLFGDSGYDRLIR